MPFYGTGSVLFSDDFTYADGDLTTVGSAKWNAGYWTGQPTHRVLSNQAANGPAQGWKDNYSKTSFSIGANGVEFIYKGIQRDANTNAKTFMHFLGAAAGSPNGYYIMYDNRSGAFYYELGEMVSGGFATKITTTQVAVAGDDVAAQILPGGVMSLWRKPSGGSWSQLGSSITDTTRSSGVLAIESFVASARWDGVEVREVPAATTSRLKRWNGSAWVVANLKKHNGSIWVPKSLKKF